MISLIQHIIEEDKEKLLEELNEKKDLITGLEIWNEREKQYYFIKLDWPRFVLYRKEKCEIETDSLNNLFKKIVCLCYPFNEFKLIVRNIIYPHPKYDDRKCHKSRELLKFTDWFFANKMIQDKHFAVTKFTYRKITPTSLLSLCYKSI